MLFSHLLSHRYSDFNALTQESEQGLRELVEHHLSVNNNYWTVMQQYERQDVCIELNGDDFDIDDYCF
jgi:hypothetical protein